MPHPQSLWRVNEPTKLPTSDCSNRERPLTLRSSMSRIHVHGADILASRVFDTLGTSGQSSTNSPFANFAYIFCSTWPKRIVIVQRPFIRSFASLRVVGVRRGLGCIPSIPLNVLRSILDVIEETGIAATTEMPSTNISTVRKNNIDDLLLTNMSDSLIDCQL